MVYSNELLTANDITSLLFYTDVIVSAEVQNSLIAKTNEN